MATIWSPPPLAAACGFSTTSLLCASWTIAFRNLPSTFSRRRQPFASTGTIILTRRCNARCPASQNPSDGAILYYSLNSPPKGEITLDVLDEKGNRVRHFSSIPEKESLPPANVPEYWFYPPDQFAHYAQESTASCGTFAIRTQRRLPFGFFGEHLDYTEYTLPDHAVPGETPRFQPPGPLVSPGTYDLVLTVDGQVVSPEIARRCRSAYSHLSRGLCCAV